MRQASLKLLCLLCLPLIVLFAGCGSTSSGSFTLSASSSSVTLAQGASKTFTVTANGANSFKGAVSVAASGLPAGVTLNPSTATISPGSPATFTLTASTTATVGTATVTLTGTSGALSGSTTVSVVVTAASGPTGPTPDFVLSVAPSSLSLAAGSSQTVTLSSTGVNAFSGTIDVTISGLPSGVTAAPSTITVTPGTPATVTLAADTTVATTTTPAQVSFLGSSGTLTHSAVLALSLTGTGTPPGSTGDFQLALSPSSLNLTSGGSTQTTKASIVAMSGFTGPVNVAIGSLPAGITVDTQSAAVTAGVSQGFRFAADATVPSGTINVTVTGTAGDLTHTVQLALIVTAASAAPDFGLIVSPSSLSIAQGNADTATIVATAINGYNGTVSVSVSGLPAGVTIAQSSFNLTTTAPVSVTFNVDSSATVGTSNVAFTGVSGTISHTVLMALTITKSAGGADFSLALAPASLGVSQGGIGQSALSATAANGFTGQVGVTVSGLPSGVTLAPSSFTLAPGTPQSLSFTIAADATPGVYSVKFTGTSGTLSHATTLTLTITPAGTGNFTLALTPAVLSVAQGSSGSTALSATASGGFSGAIQVTTSTLPAGVVLTPTPINLTAGTPVQITVAAASTVPAGTYTITFTGTSGTLTQTVQLALTVTSSSTNADFTISATPTTLSVAQGDQSDLVQVTVTGSNSFNGNVVLTVTGLPSGVTLIGGGTLQPGDSAPIGFKVSSTAAVGSYPITVTGTSGALSHSTNVTLNITTPQAPDGVTITLSPSSLTVPIGSFGSVSVTANGPSGFTGQINVSVQDLPTGVTASPSTMSLTAGVPQTFVITAGSGAQAGSSTPTFLGKINSVTGTTTLNLLVVQQASAGFDVPTWHYDNGRTGLNAFETTLTPANVKPATFGKLSSHAADGSVDAQPLFISGLAIGAQTHNVLYVATENDSVYAYDADNGAVLWQKSTLGANETASDDHGCSAITPKIGITATPVIDRNYQPNGAIFLVAMTKDSSGSYHQRLHALDLTTGAELSASPTEIAATYTPTSGGATSSFDPSLYVERAALLLSNGTLYLSWAAPCQQTSFDYNSWVMAYSEATLQQQSVLNLTPNGSGGAIWMSGAGPAADSDGNVFLATSKGTFDTTLTKDGLANPINGDYGNAFVKIQITAGVMNVYDYFEPLNGVPGSANYEDQGSGGMMVVPDISLGNVPLSVVVGAGKDGNIYQMNHVGDAMGEYSGDYDNIQQIQTGALPNGATSSPAFFNNLYYYGGIADSLKSFDPTDSSGQAVGQSLNVLGESGATPVISANGKSAAILWALDTTASSGPVLHAYSATDLTSELYNSTQAQANGVTRDTVSATGKYTVPVVINGHVYIGTQSGVDVFGLLP